MTNNLCKKTFHYSSHISQLLPQIVHILRFYLIDTLLQILQSTRRGQGCSPATNLEIHMGGQYLLDYCTFACRQ